MCSFGLMAQDGTSQKKEFKIHANSRDLNPGRNDNRHQRLEFKKDKPDNNRVLEHRGRPHFEKVNPGNSERKEKHLKERKEGKEKREHKELREHKQK